MPKPESDIIQFDEELDAIVSSDDALHTALQSDDPILKTAARLTNNSHPTLSSTARQNILASVIDAVPTKPATPPNVISGNFTAWVGRIAAMLIITIMVGLAAQPVSADSLPGDTLYPVKLGFETLELAFAGSPSARVQTLLEHADERLSEVQQLEQESDLVNETLQSAITSLNLATTVASDHAIFEKEISLAEQAQLTIINFEQVLSNNQLSTELIADVQLSIMSIRSLLPVNPTDTVELIPEVTEGIPDVIIIETTSDVTEEAIVVETTPDVTEEPQAIIPLVQTTYYIYAESRVNVRSGAGINFEIVGVATQNTPVTVINQNETGDWIEVRLPNGVQGWIFNELLDNTPGQSSGNANGSSNGNANGSSNGNANGSSNGNANGSSNGNANGSSNGNANGSSNGNANGSSNGNANGNSNGS